MCAFFVGGSLEACSRCFSAETTPPTVTLGRWAHALKKISAMRAIKNFMKQVRQMKNLTKWWCRI
jgi:hypothetical protein